MALLRTGAAKRSSEKSVGKASKHTPKVIPQSLSKLNFPGVNIRPAKCMSFMGSINIALHFLSIFWTWIFSQVVSQVGLH